MPQNFRLPAFATLLGLLFFGVVLFLVAPMSPPATAAAQESAPASSGPPSQGAEPARLGLLIPAAVAAAATTANSSVAPSVPRLGATSPAEVVVPPVMVPQGMTLHVVQRGQSLGTLVHLYLPRTKYMKGSELEQAIRETNGLKSSALKPGANVLIPGYEPEVHEKPVVVPKDFEVRAIYLTGTMAGSAKGLDLVRRWRESGGNAVVFDVKDSDGMINVPFDDPLLHAQAAYKADSPLAGRVTPPLRNLPKYVRWLHSQNMYAIARIAIFRDEYLVVHHPELAVRSRRTGQPWRENGKLVWLDPSHPAVQRYNIAMAKYAAESGVDEVQFDYVRFPAEGDQKDTLFVYEKEHPKWQRSDVIADFLAAAHKEFRQQGILFSLDVFGVMAWQRSVDLSHTGQDIPRMAQHCDILSPMIYPSHFFGMDGYANPGDAPEHFIGESMEKFRTITKDSGVLLRPWLQAFGWRTKTYSPDYIVRQVTTSKDKGGVGFLFWNANNDYSKPFVAMPVMRAKPGRYFRGDGLPEQKIAAAELPAKDTLPGGAETRQ
jgi:hypothetical protein